MSPRSEDHNPEEHRRKRWSFFGHPQIDESHDPHAIGDRNNAGARFRTIPRSTGNPEFWGVKSMVS